MSSRGTIARAAPVAAKACARANHVAAPRGELPRRGLCSRLALAIVLASIGACGRDPEPTTQTTSNAQGASSSSGGSSDTNGGMGAGGTSSGMGSSGSMGGASMGTGSTPMGTGSGTGTTGTGAGADSMGGSMGMGPDGGAMGTQVDASLGDSGMMYDVPMVDSSMVMTDSGTRDARATTTRGRTTH